MAGHSSRRGCRITLELPAARLPPKCRDRWSTGVPEVSLIKRISSATMETLVQPHRTHRGRLHQPGPRSTGTHRVQPVRAGSHQLPEGHRVRKHKKALPWLLGRPELALYR